MCGGDRARWLGTSSEQIRALRSSIPFVGTGLAGTMLLPPL
jgi:hypothetical protein